MAPLLIWNTNMKIAVLGCGKMAQALFLGAKELLKNDEVFTYTPSHTRALELAKAVGGTNVQELSKLPLCDVIFIACKPQQFNDLAESLGNQYKDSLMVSLMAGVKVASIIKKLGSPKVIRTMANTPSLIGEGVTLWMESGELDTQIKQKVLDIFSSVSFLYEVKSDDEIDFLTSFSGSGPAYVFEWARIFIEKMKTRNISEIEAKKIIGHTFLGASKLLLESSEDAETLRKNVTSPQGVTYEALKVFENRGMQDIIGQAMDNAYSRAVELSKE